MATTTDQLVYGVCIGGALVDDGEYADPAAAIERAQAEYRKARAEGSNEPVQVLLWPA